MHEAWQGWFSGVSFIRKNLTCSQVLDYRKGRTQSQASKKATRRVRNLEAPSVARSSNGKLGWCLGAFKELLRIIATSDQHLPC